jgi:hypothetical protein
MHAEPVWRLDEDAPGPRKPLYLRGGPGMRIDADGPALRLRRPAKAAVWYPLARLARVLSKGEVRWSCEALLACAEVGVPVVFLNRDGDVRAYLFGASSGESVLYGRLRACLRRSDVLNRYASWRRAMMDHARQALEWQLQQAGVCPEPVLAWRGVMPVRRGMVVAVLARAVVRRLRGLLAGLSAQLLAEAGLNAERLADLEPLTLVDDLAELLSWALAEPALVATWHRAGPGPDGHDEQTLMVLVEARRDEVFRFGRLLLGRLRQWLED